MARQGPVTKDASTVPLGLAQIRVGKAAANIASIEPVLDAAASIGALVNTKYTGTVEWYEFSSGFPSAVDLTIPMAEAAMLECAFNEFTPFNFALASGLDPFADVSATIAEIGAVTIAGTTTGVLAVTDAGGVTSERFTVIFTSATEFSVYGEVSGHIGDAANLTSEYAPDNGGNPYFSIPADYFSGTWAADETYIFVTTAMETGTSAYADNHSGSLGLGNRSLPKYIRMEAVYTYPNGTNAMTIIFPRSQCAASVEIDFQNEEAASSPLTFKATPADGQTVGGNAVWDDFVLGRVIFS